MDIKDDVVTFFCLMLFYGVLIFIHEAIMFNKYLPFVSSLLVFLHSATLLVTGKSYSYVALLLCLIALFLLPITLKHKLPSDFYRISFAFLCYFLITALSLFMFGGKLSNLDMPGRTILILPAFILLLQYPPKKDWLFSGVLVGTVLAGLIAIYHYFFLQSRAFMVDDYMVIQSGNMAMSLGVFSLIIAIQYLKEKRLLGVFIACACAFLGVLASLLSGARGSWVVAPFILLGLLIVNRELITKKIALVLTLVVIASAALSYNMVEQRVQKAMQDLTKFSEQGDSRSSLGARIEMWKSGYYTFIENPIFGIGYEVRQDYKQSLVDRELVGPIVMQFTRLHNSYMEELSIKGIIGFATLLLFFGWPLYLIFKRGDLKYDVFTQLGVAHILLVMGYSVTQNYINHHSGMLHYLMYTIIFYSLVRANQKNFSPK